MKIYAHENSPLYSIMVGEKVIAVAPYSMFNVDVTQVCACVIVSHCT